jgi:hypothetical protein
MKQLFRRLAARFEVMPRKAIYFIGVADGLIIALAVVYFVH